jgi:hypothetical protein
VYWWYLWQWDWRCGIRGTGCVGEPGIGIAGGPGVTVCGEQAAKSWLKNWIVRIHSNWVLNNSGFRDWFVSPAIKIRV